MTILAQLVAWLNAVASALGGVVLAPVAVLPGWLSSTLVAAVTGVLMLVAFKHTSNQVAIKRARDQIKANLLALSLFKESLAVSLRAQGRILWNALKLLLLAVGPMLVMLVPMCLILGQLALWYQARPLAVGEEAVVVVRLAGDPQAALPEVSLQPDPALTVKTGPVRVTSAREVCWNIVATQPGYHRLEFLVGGQPCTKELAAGSGYMRVSLKRPELGITDPLLHPWESPLGPRDPVRSIEIQYPERSAWTSGTHTWLAYWFGASMVFALLFRKPLDVNL